MTMAEAMKDREASDDARWRAAWPLILFTTILIVIVLARWGTHRPEISIRWSDEASSAQRAQFEAQVGLVEIGQRGGNRRTFGYRLRTWTSADLRLIVEHPAVEDTAGIDRRVFNLERGPPSRLAHAGLSLFLALVCSTFVVSLIPGRRSLDALGSAQAEPGERTNSRRWHWWASGYLCALLVVSTVGLQFATFTQLSNDHSGYLAMARQILLGELPIRDFLDHGTFLHSLVSSGLQWMFGHRLLAEMVLSTGLIALGYCITFVLASTLSRSNLTGFLLALSCALTIPRPYSYPKVFIYPLAIWLIWSYLRRPSSRGLVILGLTAGLSFMMRVDHGVVLISAATALVLLRHVFDDRERAARSVGTLLGWFCIGLAPLLVYIALTVGVIEYLAMILEFGRRAMTETNAFRSHVLLLGAEATGPQAVVAVIHDSYLVITVAAIGGVGWRAFLETRATGRPGELTLRLATALAVWLVAAPMLIRDAFVARFADVAPIVAILGAGLIATVAEPLEIGGTDGAGTGHARIRRLARVVTSVIVVGMLLVPNVSLHGGPSRVIAVHRDAMGKFSTTVRVYAESPPWQILSENLRQIVRYVDACTEPEDRLLVTWYAPEIYFASNRRFAGNQWVYVDYHNSVEQQQEVLRLLGQQSVPLVFERQNDSPFAGFWPLLTDHIEREYHMVGIFGDALVYADRRKETFRADAVTGLPCFTPATPVDVP